MGFGVSRLAQALGQCKPLIDNTLPLRSVHDPSSLHEMAGYETSKLSGLVETVEPHTFSLQSLHTHTYTYIYIYIYRVYSIVWVLPQPCKRLHLGSYRELYLSISSILSNCYGLGVVPITSRDQSTLSQKQEKDNKHLAI